MTTCTSNSMASRIPQRTTTPGTTTSAELLEIRQKLSYKFASLAGARETTAPTPISAEAQPPAVTAAVEKAALSSSIDRRQIGKVCDSDDGRQSSLEEELKMHKAQTRELESYLEKSREREKSQLLEIDKARDEAEAWKEKYATIYKEAQDKLRSAFEKITVFQRNAQELTTAHSESSTRIEELEKTAAELEQERNSLKLALKEKEEETAQLRIERIKLEDENGNLATEKSRMQRQLNEVYAEFAKESAASPDTDFIRRRLSVALPESCSADGDPTAKSASQSPNTPTSSGNRAQIADLQAQISELQSTVATLTSSVEQKEHDNEELLLYCKTLMDHLDQGKGPPEGPPDIDPSQAKMSSVDPHPASNGAEADAEAPAQPESSGESKSAAAESPPPAPALEEF